MAMGPLSPVVAQTAATTPKATAAPAPRAGTTAAPRADTAAGRDWGALWGTLGRTFGRWLALLLVLLAGHLSKEGQELKKSHIVSQTRTPSPLPVSPS